MTSVIGITTDSASGKDAARRYHSSAHYARAVAQAGGAPLLLPHERRAIEHYLKICDGLILSGGDDPDTRAFGQPLHPHVKLISPRRQAFEMRLLRALDHTRHPVLGVCLGMQMMALHHGGRLHQHLPDSPAVDAAQAEHHAHGEHTITPAAPPHPRFRFQGNVHSHHHQAVARAGSMRIAACSEDGVIEALALDSSEPAGEERFYLGVQWHPERTLDPALGAELIRALVREANPRP